MGQKVNPHGARVGVLGLDAPGDSVRWANVEPCYVFHPCNAYEAGDGTIIVIGAILILTILGSNLFDRLRQS